MSTIKKQLLKALKEKGESPEDLEAVFYQTIPKGCGYDDTDAPIIKCTFDELPEREFDSSYGAVEGGLIIAFTKDWVYVKVTYDGAEWIDAVPRNPESVLEKINERIPIFGC